MNEQQAREEQVAREITEYRERMKDYVYSEAELTELRTIHGIGAVVVDVFAGRRIQL